MRVKLGDYQRWARFTTDLILTAPEVWTSGEQLRDPRSLTDFLDSRQIPHGTIRLDDLAAVHDVRARIRDLIDQPDPTQQLAQATALTTGAVASLHLDPAEPHGNQWAITIPDDHPGPLLASLAALGILSTSQALGQDRIRNCAAPTCNGAFIDTSRGGQRRYCMPDLCGNRINVAQHRSRTAAARNTSPKPKPADGRPAG